MDFSKFKRCPSCLTWFSADEVMESPWIVPIGMVLESENLNMNLFYFNHSTSSCGTTFAIPVTAFQPFITHEITLEILAGSGLCELHCFTVEDRNACSQKCFYAPYRELLRKMMEARGIQSPMKASR